MLNVNNWLLKSPLPFCSGVSSSAPPSPPKTIARPKSSVVLQTELDAANARIKVLEERLAAAGLSTE